MTAEPTLFWCMPWRLRDIKAPGLVIAEMLEDAPIEPEDEGHPKGGVCIDCQIDIAVPKRAEGKTPICIYCGMARSALSGAAKGEQG